jgi:hypothetical protein
MRSISDSRSPQSEFHRHFDEHIDRDASKAGGSEAPLTNRDDGPLVEACPGTPEHANVPYGAIGPDHNFEEDVASEIAAPRFIGVSRLHFSQ